MDAEDSRTLKAVRELTDRWKQRGFDLLQGGRLFLKGLPANPTSLPDGLLWHRSDTDALHARLGGTTETIGLASDLTTHEAASNPHPGYATDGDLTTHAAAADPHAGYVLESLIDAKGDILAGSADDTPARVAVGSNFRVLMADSAATPGVKWGDAAVVLARTGATTISNTTTETTIVSQSIPANALGSTGKIRFQAIGQYLNSSGGDDTLRLRVKFGGTTHNDDITANIASAANARPLRIEVEIGNFGTASQWIWAKVELGAGAVATNGIGDLATVNPVDGSLAASATIDTTSARTFEVSLQLGTMNASILAQVLNGTVELL